MEYAAIILGADGGIVRHKDTQEVLNMLVGDFDSMEDAIEGACATLECKHLHKGVLSKGKDQGGYMLVTTQELGEV
ncbi:hypothetical protein MHO82_21020 [Vibrio sp. Of7-15]|uniref:hypothetical protein n=1 Tax=Vibrio sp. Of7-15 TaxID=2724879 RepID=UPI001EF3BFDC|nr:hypothetical protein [Vibrio sp. Of7-15]MCG7499351.1 hypothetical protein [Vibrio sp. Of7-15]